MSILGLTLSFTSGAFATTEPSPDVLRFGVIDLEPYSMIDNVRGAGLFAETTVTLMTELNIRSTVQPLPLGRLISSLSQGDIDVALIASVAALNNPNVVPLTPVFKNAHLSILSRQSSDISSLEDFANRIVSVPSIKAIQNHAETLPMAHFQQIHSYRSAINLLHLQRIDGVLGLEPTLRYFSRALHPEEEVTLTIFFESSIDLFRSTQSAHTDDIWQLINQDVVNLRERGVFHEIALRYIPDWPQNDHVFSENNKKALDR